LKEWKGKCHEIVVDDAFDAEQIIMMSAVILCGGGARRENGF
jgi:hypothetical protein